MKVMKKEYVQQAFDTNWIAPLGPNVTGFENELAEKSGHRICGCISIRDSSHPHGTDGSWG